MLRIDRDNFTSPSPTWMAFLSFSCPVALARTSSAVLNGSDESGHLCLVPDLEGKFQFFTLEYDVSCVLFIYGLYYVERVSFYS